MRIAVALTGLAMTFAVLHAKAGGIQQGSGASALPNAQFGPYNGPEPSQRIRDSVDVGWLEHIAVSEPLARSMAMPFGYSPKGLRSGAYLRLGVIGSTESIAALLRIEAHFRTLPMLALRLLPNDPLTHPAPYMGDGGATVASLFESRAVGPAGREFRVANLDYLGERAPYVIWRATGDSDWSRPFLSGGPVGSGDWKCQAVSSNGETYIPRRPVVLTLSAPDSLLLEFAPCAQGPAPRTILVADLLRDSDADGWTDIEERWMGTDPGRSDSDGDGIPDGRDVCPLYAPPATESSDEDARILERAVFALFGLAESHYALLVDEGSRPVQFSGLLGPVLYGKRQPTDMAKSGGVYVRWKITGRTADAATVEIDDYEGPLAASGSELKLRKVDREWVVVSCRMLWIS